MSLEEKIYSDFIQARKAKETHKIEFLSLVRSDLKNEAINSKKEKLDDDQVLAILKKQQKRLLDAKEVISSSERKDLIEALEKELEILNQYLPQPLSDDQVLAIIDEAISSTGASSIKDMGRVMKEVLAKVGVKADSKKVSNLVREKLSS
tara:strand:+ start:375 stop:824 length:450 start_codon:yes stop_codon:yes gene_type:complete